MYLCFLTCITGISAQNISLAIKRMINWSVQGLIEIWISVMNSGLNRVIYGYSYGPCDNEADIMLLAF